MLAPGEVVEIGSLPKEVTQTNERKDLAENFSKSDYEKDQILKALKKTNFNKSQAAKLLQVTRKTLYNKINHYKLDL